jgi:2',3'-cyclic-nucleotide 2'-phosphodiesterase (5'-nucleotidase family)
MKKYLILSIILSLALVLPVICLRWKEGRRLRQIDKIKREAFPPEGTKLVSVLSLLESEKPSFVILYTGNTKGYLETCGCFAGQSGGVARRATVLSALREKIQILVLDAGGILQGSEPLDRLRTSVYLESMKKMGYDAVCPEGDEMDFIEKSSLTLISTNGDTSTASPHSLTQGKQMEAKARRVPSIMKELGGVKIGILGLSRPSGAYSKETLLTPLLMEISSLKMEKVEIVVLLSNLPIKTIREVARKVRGIDYIISSSEGEPEKLGSTYLLKSFPKGEKLGFLAVRAKTKESFYGSIPLFLEVPEDQKIRTVIQQFYKTVAQEQRFQKGERLREVKGDGYIGSEDCRECHAGEYEQWSQTPHAGSYLTLLRKNRHFYPDCVQCHTTGFGYKTGYQIGICATRQLVAQ